MAKVQALHPVRRPQKHIAIASTDELICVLYDESMRRGFTIAALANRSGVCRSTLRNWFSGRTTRPQTPTLNAVGKVFGIELTWTPRR